MQYDRSISDLFQDALRHLQEIVRAEVLLAKTEIKEEAIKSGKALALLGIGVAVALYAVGFLLLTIVYALENAFPPWLAGFIVAMALVAAAIILIGLGRTRSRQIHVTPEKTIQTMKENIEWAKHPTK